MSLTVEERAKAIEAYKKLLPAVANVSEVVEKIADSEGSIAAKISPLLEVLPELARLSDLEVKDLKLPWAGFTAEERVEVFKAFSDNLDLRRNDLEFLVREISNLFFVSLPPVIKQVKLVADAVKGFKDFESTLVAVEDENKEAAKSKVASAKKVKADEAAV